MEGQPFERRVVVAGAELRLNGTGVRAVAWFKGYAAGLYLTRRAATAAAPATAAEAALAPRWTFGPFTVDDASRRLLRDGVEHDVPVSGLRPGDVVRVRPEVTALVTFRQQNLADADLPRGFDLVWCRNVLIYFGPEARMRVLEKIVASLAPGGFLFVGYSETLRDVAYGDKEEVI